VAHPSILLIDDDRGTLEVYGKFFEHAGWTYDLVADGKSAIEHAKTKEYDVILTDLVLPGGVDGFQVLREVKAHKPEQAVIILTGEASVDDVVKSLREGAADILFKPIDFHALRGAVERVLQGLKNQGSEECSIYRYLTNSQSIFEIPAVVFATTKFQIGIVQRLAKAGIISRSLQLRLQLAVQEAVANSLEHGVLELESHWKEEFDTDGVDKFSRIKQQRLADPEYGNRKLRISVKLENLQLRIAIKDSGVGFALKENAPDERLTGPLRSYGRGLAIIAGIMDELFFQENGTEIVMVKYLI